MTPRTGKPALPAHKELHAALLTAELSNREFAELCGCSVRAVERWLSGDRMVPPVVQRVAWLLARGLVSREAFRRAPFVPAEQQALAVKRGV